VITNKPLKAGFSSAFFYDSGISPSLYRFGLWYSFNL